MRDAFDAAPVIMIQFRFKIARRIELVENILNMRTYALR